MNNTHHTKEQAREFLIQEALNEICDITDFTKFYTHIYYILAKYGLQLNAKEDQLFSGDEWRNPARKEFLIRRVEQFLYKHIK